MKSVPPDTGAPEITIAKDQPPYLPLYGAIYEEEGETMICTRWSLTDEERLKIAEGADIYMTHLTFGQKFHPIRVMVGPQWLTVLTNTDRDNGKK